MMKEAVATGRTVDDAIDNACAALGHAREDVEFEIIDLPRRGFLGLTQTPAKVKVWIEVAEPVKKTQPAPPAREEQPKQPPQPPKPKQEQPKQEQPKQQAQKPPQPKPQQPQQPAQPQHKQEKPPRQERAEPVSDRPLSAQAVSAKEYLAAVLVQMGLEDARLQVTQREDAVHIRLTGDENGAAIGRRGETLDALQYLTSLAANRSGEEYTRVVLDSGNYRDKRRRTLEQLAKRLAGNAVKSGKSTTLEPMNPYERRIIHAAVSEVEGATSVSVGEEPNRCVIISAAGSPAPRTGESRPRPQGKGGQRPRQGKPGRGGGGRRDGGNRREKPEPYKESAVREVAPSEAKNQPLYGKIEL